jgi:hypothetical protein
MGVENSPQRAKRKREFEQRQQKRWAKRNGPVTVRFVDPATLRPASARGEGTEGTTTSSYGSAGDSRVDLSEPPADAPSSSAG